MGIIKACGDHDDASNGGDGGEDQAWAQNTQQTLGQALTPRVSCWISGKETEA